jgi:hypothetical protein
MWGKKSEGSGWRAGAVMLALASGCAVRAFPRELFTITGERADYPVMLSQAPPGIAGRKIAAVSGTRASRSTSTYTVGKTTVSTIHTSESESELPASVKLGAQVLRDDRWLQIDHAEFHAEDFATYGAAAATRELAIEGTVVR